IGSPLPGGSTLMTSAPKYASTEPVNGPAINCPTSSTRTPSSGRGGRVAVVIVQTPWISADVSTVKPKRVTLRVLAAAITVRALRHRMWSVDNTDNNHRFTLRQRSHLCNLWHGSKHFRIAFIWPQQKTWIPHPDFGCHVLASRRNSISFF